MIKPIKKAVFPVAGFGTRFLPATKAIPKEMIPIGVKPLIQHVFEEALQAGIKEFIFITGRNKEALVNHFDHAYELEELLESSNKTEALEAVRDWLPNDVTVSFVRQKKAKGLGHAVLCAKDLVGDNPFAVLLPDELVLAKKGTLAQMMDVYNKLGGNVLAVKEVDPQSVSKYGIVATEDSDTEYNNLYKISNMVEKPKVGEAPSNLSITGRYILQPEIFDFIDLNSKGQNGEIQLTDAMVAMMQSNKYYALCFEGERFDCGNQIGALEANIAYALNDSSIKQDVVNMFRKYCNRIN